MNYQLTKDALPLFNSPEKSTFSPVNDVCFTTRSTHLPRTLRMYSTRVPPAKGAVRHLRSSRLRRTAPCVAWPPSIRMCRTCRCRRNRRLVESDNAALLVEAGFLDRHRRAACLQAVLFRNGRVDGDGVIAVIGNGEGPFAVRRGFGFRGCLPDSVMVTSAIGFLSASCRMPLTQPLLAVGLHSSTACAPESAADAMAGGSTKSIERTATIEQSMTIPGRRCRVRYVTAVIGFSSLVVFTT